MRGERRTALREGLERGERRGGEVVRQVGEERPEVAAML